MTVNEKEKDDVTWATDRLWDTYKRHCEKNGDEYISYEEFTENLKRKVVK
jgi:hypothetical protein